VKISHNWKVDEPRPGIGEGRQNTDSINVTRKGFCPAVEACVNYTLGGYDDWFLPSKDELDQMYRNLKQKGLGNFAGGRQYGYDENIRTNRVRAVRAFWRKQALSGKERSRRTAREI
jgi:hypothetical protein